jgi:hypothetical protein
MRDHWNSFYWHYQISNNIKNKNLRCWVGSIIWWNENDCRYHQYLHNNKEINKSKLLKQNWEWFEHFYVDNYNKDYLIPIYDLESALKSIGYEVKLPKIRPQPLFQPSFSYP